LPYTARDKYHSLTHQGYLFMSATESKSVESKLAALNLTLPPASTPAGNYVPYVVSGNLVFISGQIPMIDGKPAMQGVVGADFSVEQAAQAAQLCGLSLIAHLRNACNGDLSRVVRCVKLTGFVQCVAGFTEQPAVINGASDLMVAAFGDKGRHARAAVGCNALPRGVATEVEGVFEIS
jgi:enamine deaminase RidA (YjgF/YER057c/UK114 family)